MALSTNTILTLGAVLLVIFILSVCKQAISTVMGVVALLLVAVFVIQTTSDVVLVDFENPCEVGFEWALRLFKWTQESFWPSLTEVARGIEQNI